MNPLGKIPCLKVCKLLSSVTRARFLLVFMGLQDGDFVVSESAAIMRYLAQVNEVPDHWYPSEQCT